MCGKSGAPYMVDMYEKKTFIFTAVSVAAGVIVTIVLAITSVGLQERTPKMLAADSRVEAVFDEGDTYSCLKKGSPQIFACHLEDGKVVFGNPITSKDADGRFVGAARSADIKAVKDSKGKDYLKALKAPKPGKKMTCIIAGKRIGCTFDGKNLVTWE